MEGILFLIKNITQKRMVLNELYNYIYVEKLECGRTRNDVFANDEIDLLDDHENYLMAVMDAEEAEKKLSIFKKMYEAQLIKQNF